MEVPNISWTPDIIILVILGVVIAYGFVLGRNKVKTLALSVYVGIVIATELGARLHQLLVGRGWDLGGTLNQNVVQVGTMLLPLVILEIGRREHHPRGHHQGGVVMTLILCILTAALAVSSGLQLLDPDTLKYITDHSWLATAVHGLRLWWLGLVPLAVIGENFIKPKEHY